MAHRTWMLGLWLGLVGFSVATGCVVKSDDDDDSDDAAAGAAGDDSGGGTGGGGRGGSSGSGGSGGSTGGSGGATGGSSGAQGGGGSGSGGTTGGTSGTGGGMETAECDPDEGNLVNTPYPDCEPANATDDCEVCIEMNCCEESRVCFGYDPGNVCGYGGPLTGIYADLSEFDCYRFCAEDEVEANDGVYDETVTDTCVGECVTAMCGTVIGNATQDMITCMDMNCEDECYQPEM